MKMLVKVINVPVLLVSMVIDVRLKVTNTLHVYYRLTKVYLYFYPIKMRLLAYSRIGGTVCQGSFQVQCVKCRIVT